MPIVKASTGRRGSSAQPPIHYRYVRMVAPKRVAPHERGSGLPSYPLTGSATRLMAPGPAWIPEVIAMEQLAERRAMASPPAVAAPRTTVAAPAPAELADPISPQGLLGW